MNFSKKNILIWLLWFLIFWISSFFVIRRFYPNLSDSWSFGDTFWAINSIFSWLAFFGVIITIFIQSEQLKKQSEELEVQKEELKMTRQELAKAAKAQETQIQLQSSIAILNYYNELSKLKNETKISWNDLHSMSKRIESKLEQIQIEKEVTNALETIKLLQWKK